MLHPPLGPDGRIAIAVSSRRAAPSHHDGDVGRTTRARFRRARNILWASFFLAGVPAFGCGSPAPTEPTEDPAVRREKLLDPETCKECHLQHFQEWSASMHAYASADPVFIAMNRRGQEETGGKLGSFCVNCHAPMAVREGKTTDGLNLEDLPPKLRGITCYFCHNVASVEGTHNNPIVLANDDVMRGSFTDPPPVKSPAHASQYSPFMLGSSEKSAQFCGACHDIVLDTPAAPPPAGNGPVKLERTYSEWQDSVFAFGPGRSNLACAAHHMPPSPLKDEGPAAEAPGIPVVSRKLHEHLFPGVDVAITRFPDTGNLDEDTRLETHHRERIQHLLNTTLQVNELCVYDVDVNRSRVSVSLENLTAGHSWPSGASHDRRAWVEVKAYLDGQPTPVYQSGVVADGEDIAALAASNPDVWLIKDRLRGVVAGKEPHMFWDIIESLPGTLPARTTSDPTMQDAYNNHRVRQFPRQVSATIPAPADPARLRVTVLVRLQPMGFDVLDDLIASKHLDPEFRAKMPIFNVLPNVTYADRFPQFREVSFEWSDAVRRSRIFLTTQGTEGGVAKDCVGQIARK